MNNSKLTKLEDIAAPINSALSTGPFGSAVSAKHFKSEGIPMLRGQNLSEDTGVRLIEDDFVYMSPELANKYKRSIVRKGDLVFTSWGTVGQVGLVDDSAHFDSYLLSNKQMKMTPDLEQVVPLYLYYYLSQPKMIWEVKARSIGSSVPGFNLGQLKKLPVLLPSLQEQRAIAEVLGALDDKITANNKLITVADALSQSIFLASLQINPKTLPLSSIADFINGKAFTKDASGTGRVVIRIAEMNSGISTSTVFNDIEVDDKHIARPGDILFAWSGSLTLQRWFRPEGIINQHIFKVIARDAAPDWLVYELIRDKIKHFRRIAADKATTMGHIQRKNLDEPVLVPNESAQQDIAPLMRTLWKSMLNAEQENLTLASLRDTLLPQLMSGKIRVREAESIVEDVL